ncbi:MAG: DUF4382 domain-containing protein [Haloferacaceae archaeon]
MSTRRQYLRTVGGAAALGSAALAGCTGGGGDTGTLATRVSDQPGDISDFESCLVTVAGVRVKPTDGELVKRDVEPTEVDLTELRGERSALVAEEEFATGEYEFLQLRVTETTGTLKSGEEATVEVPGDAPLKFEKRFEIRAGERTTFTADFTPVRAGRTGRYLLKPVADEVTVAYEGETATGTGTGG